MQRYASYSFSVRSSFPFRRLMSRRVSSQWASDVMDRRIRRSVRCRFTGDRFLDGVKREPIAVACIDPLLPATNLGFQRLVNFACAVVIRVLPESVVAM